jgi:plastocyanin
VLGALWLAVPAAAHGPSVAVSYRGVQPPTLTIRVGEKVHFRNANPTGSPCTVVLDDGSATGPTLGRSKGWHHPFEQAGRFGYHLAEMPSAKGVVIVVEE